MQSCSTASAGYGVVAISLGKPRGVQQQNRRRAFSATGGFWRISSGARTSSSRTSARSSSTFRPAPTLTPGSDESQHALLACGQSTLTFAPPQITDDLGHLGHIAGCNFSRLASCSAATSWSALRCAVPSSTSNTRARPSASTTLRTPISSRVLCRDSDHQIVLAPTIELVFAFDRPGFYVFDDGRPMIGVDHRFTDFKVILCDPFPSYP